MPRRALIGMSDNTNTPTPSDLAHDLNRAKVETREEIHIAKQELREEFGSRLKAQTDLLVATGTARHDKAMLRMDEMQNARGILLDSLKETLATYRCDVDRRFGEAAMRYQERFDTQKEAISKAEESANKRFDSVNEFRNTLSDQATRLFTRAEAEARFNAISDKMSTLNDMTVAIAGNNRGNREAVDDRRASTNTTSVVLTCAGGFLLIFVTIAVAAISLHNSSSFVSNPTVGADTKRVDDLIAARTAETTQRTADQAAMVARFDALSARLNALTSALSQQPAAPAH